jgi:type IV pilus assembly protein PilY1
MNKIGLILSALCFSAFSLADDTEIYGANSIDAKNRVNSNVMFIMDTSGSMGAKVRTHPTFNPAGAYDGDYLEDHVYSDKDIGANDGHINSALEVAGSSTDCNNIITTLNSVGKAQGEFTQLRSNWWGTYWYPYLQYGNDLAISCDSGNNYWLYTGKYMNWYHNYKNITDKTRLEVVVEVLNELTLSLNNINLGLMRFDRNSHGGMIDVPVTDVAISGPKIRDELALYKADGYTPLTETMHEAARYYRGETWGYGASSTPNHSIDSSISDKKYKSPMESECQKNHVILLTDGQPSQDEESNTYIKSQIANIALPDALSKSCYSSGGCLDELAYWMKNTDHADGKVGIQDLTTYTIGGFNLTNGVDLLTRTANFGGGRYYAADDTTGLIDALDAIFLDILATDSTFTAPAVSVNAFNASEHRDELFYALFRPADNVKWAGNLKKYKLLSDGLVVGKDTTVPAISTATGFFNESISDYWNTSNDPDGKNVQLGGMTSKLTGSPLSRNIVSNKDNTDDQTFASYTATGSDSVANKTSFEITTDTEFTNVHNWSIGQDVYDIDGDNDVTESRQSIGDPLHSEPVIATYGGTATSPISTIFFGTNEGFLHGLDTETGEELFSFIPKELHNIQKIYYENTAAAEAKPYGMDGPITTWFKDVNSNNLLYSGDEKDPGEHIYLYAGMRRGGNNYYALDVSDRTTPTMKFMIEGGTSNFSKLGQTWAKMTPAKVKFGTEEKFVLFFSGGYDTNQDSNTTRQDDAVGNAIYMVDASTGDLLWWASNLAADLNIATMTNSIPASISAVDITGDGFINYLFAADTGGRVFRIDINQTNAGKTNFALGGEIASLAGSDAVNNRRFYNKPNVALVKDKQLGDYLTIAIGSGYRAHPILTTDVQNRFYMIKDLNPYEAPATYASKSEAPLDQATLGEAEIANPNLLYNASSLMSEGEIALTPDMQIIMSTGGGWYVEMKTKGEKVLSESTTFSGAVIFTSFAPSLDGGRCGADTGTSRTYALSQKLAMATVDLNGDGKTDSDDASTILAHSGIAPRPVVIYRKGGGKSIAIGTETIDDNRFKSNAAAPCVALGTCEAVAVPASKCDSTNCYVTPVYWRQNNNQLVAPEE